MLVNQENSAWKGTGILKARLEKAMKAYCAVQRRSGDPNAWNFNPIFWSEESSPLDPGYEFYSIAQTGKFVISVKAHQDLNGPCDGLPGMTLNRSLVWLGLFGGFRLRPFLSG